MLITATKKLTATWIVAGLLGLILGFLLYQIVPRSAHQAPDIPSLLWPNPKALAPFQLKDQDGHPFDLEHLKGKWTFLFFGYTHCPDVCPVTLAVLDNVEKLLRDSSGGLEDVQVVFVSLDPQRDTPERLGKFVDYFNKDFLGVTGTEEKLAALTRQLGIVHMRTEPDANGYYLVDHTASVLLTDPKARFIGLFGAPHDAKVIAQQFEQIRDFVEG